VYRADLLSGEGGGARRQGNRRETQARADQHGVWAAEGRQPHLAAQQVHRSPESEAHDQEEAMRLEFKHCKFTTEAIVSEGIDKGELRKVCTEPTCPVHYPKQRPQRIAGNAKQKAEQEKQRKEQAIANTIGLRTLAAISAAVPVRLMKRDLLFIVERLVSILDENRLEMLAPQQVSGKSEMMAG
jgi:hypothetical protein